MPIKLGLGRLVAAGQDEGVPEDPEPRLTDVISAALAAHDPLDPWLVVSNYDEHYWDDVAAQVAPEVARAGSEIDLFIALAGALDHLVSISDSDPYPRDRVRQAAAAIWRWQAR